MSYVVEIECLDTDKTACFNKHHPLSFFTIFGGNPNTHMQQNLKMTFVLGVSMLVQGSSGWLLWSYVVEIVRPDKQKTGYMNKDLIIDILLFFAGCQVPTYSRI